MRTFILTIITTLVVISLPINNEVKAQDPINQYDGIPLVIYPELRVEDFELMYENPYQQMENMGIYGVVAGDVLDNAAYINSFSNHNLKVIPHYLWGEPANQYILRYTDAHYTIWETEGIDPENGKAALFYDTIYTNSFNEGVREGRWAGGSGVPDGDTLINGPGYSQNIKYRFFDNAYVNYFAEYQMKITLRDPELPQGYLQDVVCTLKVTATNTTGSTEYPLAERILTVADFSGWNTWDSVQVDEAGYNFEELPTEYQQPFDVMHQVPLKFNASYIQFKVIWAGLDYLNLYIDKIRVYDDLGLRLVEESGIGSPESDISTLVTTYNNYPTIIGWYGLDEPQSIDNYEPFRVVDRIVDSVSQANNWPMPLHTGFTGGWNGKYGQFEKGTHPLYPAEEFWLKAKTGNIRSHLANTITHTKK